MRDDVYDLRQVVHHFTSKLNQWRLRKARVVANLLYLTGSICFAAGTIWNMVHR